jgi:hypothetical protein
MNAEPIFTDDRGRPIKEPRKTLRAKFSGLNPTQKAFVGMVILFLTAPILMAAVTQIDLSTQAKGTLATSNGGTGTTSTLSGVVRGGSAYTAAELSGDATTSGSNAVTVVKVNGTTVPTNAAADQVIRTTSSGVATWGTLADTSAGGLAETYNTSTHAFGTISVLSGSFADNETPSGTIDGSNTVFTLAHTPSPAASLTCMKNGQWQIAGGADFTLATATITYTAGGKPLTGDAIRCNYRF